MGNISARDAISGLKNIGSTIYSGIESVSNFVYSGMNSIDNFLDGFSGVPVIGGLADLVQDNPIYQGLLQGSHILHDITSVVGQGGGIVDLLSGRPGESRAPIVPGARGPGPALGPVGDFERSVQFTQPTRVQDFSSIAIA